ncbi:MAG: CTP synthase, partial [Chloroflexota bacterium]|nr:CTP synthase [Chloroflexota bacterium]
IQVIPHITNEIKERIQRVAKQTGAGVVIVEVGGTVGDIEGLPFLEAIRQMRAEVGRHNVLYMHVTLLPHIGATDELKTKPTQHSVNELRRIGIQPDILICRADHPVTEELREKIALFGDVSKDAVIPLETVDTIYEVPRVLERAALGKLITRELGLDTSMPDLRGWTAMVEQIKVAKPALPIAIVGKYVKSPDAYMSIVEALAAAGLCHNVDIDVRWIDSEDLERESGVRQLDGVAGILVGPGFGNRGIEGKIRAARFARENKIPYFGICLGMQVAVIELARHLLHSNLPNSTEFDEATQYPVIDIMPEQRDVAEKGGTMRLGVDKPCRLVPGTRAASAYDQPIVYERHRHRYEVNNEFRELLTAGGLVLAGLTPDERLVEMIELRDHPWFVASQFHPEFKSRPERPHPLFRDFVGAAKERILVPPVSHGMGHEETVAESETVVDLPASLPTP